MRRASTQLLVLAAALAALVLAVVGLTRAPAQAEPPPTVEPVVAAAPGWVDVQGGTRHLSLPLDGIVIHLAAPGDTPVAAGTVLLRLDDAALKLDQQAITLAVHEQQRIEHSRAEQLHRAEAEVARVRALVQIQAEPADNLRAAQAQALAQQDALDTARFELAQSRLRERALELQRRQHILVAPRRGRVLRIDVHEGEAVSRDAPVLWFAPEAPMIVRAELDERLFPQLRVGMKAEVEAESGDGHVFPATLLSVAHSIGPVREIPERRAAAQDDRVVECVLGLGASQLLIGQRVIVRIRGLP